MDITVRIHYEQLSLNPKLKLDSALAISKLRENTFHYNLSYFKHFLNVKKVGSNSGTMIENTIEITVFNCLASIVHIRIERKHFLSLMSSHNGRAILN